MAPKHLPRERQIEYIHTLRGHVVRALSRSLTPHTAPHVSLSLSVSLLKKATSKAAKTTTRMHELLRVGEEMSGRLPHRQGAIHRIIAKPPWPRTTAVCTQQSVGVATAVIAPFTTVIEECVGTLTCQPQQEEISTTSTHDHKRQVDKSCPQGNTIRVRNTKRGAPQKCGAIRGSVAKQFSIGGLDFRRGEGARFLFLFL